MSALPDAQRAYATTTRSTGTPRATEFKVFNEVTSAMRRGEKVRDSDFGAYISALSRNLKLWTIIGADAANDRNALPP